MIKRDLSICEDRFQEHCPLTKFYKEAHTRLISTSNNFLSAFLNSNAGSGERAEHKAREFYQLYEQFCKDHGLQVWKSKTSFGIDVNNTTGVTKQQGGQGIIYIVDMAALKKDLEDKNLYNEDVFLDQQELPT